MLRRALLPLVPLALALTACPEDGIETVAPKIVVEPAAIDLGATPFRTTKTHTLSIKNTGGVYLTVSGVAFREGESPADLALVLPEELPVRVDPSLSWSFELNHLPRDQVLDGATLVIQSDDPARPTVEVPVTQSAVGAPNIAAVPDPAMADLEADTPGGVSTTLVSIDLGVVPVGQRRMRGFSVVNIGGGNQPLLIESVEVVDPASAPGFSVSASPDLSASELLLPILGQKTRNVSPRSLDLVVAWQPPVAGASLAAVVRLRSSDPDQPQLDIPVTASTTMVDPPVLRLDPPSGVSFGVTPVGMMKSATFTAHNDGQGVLVLQPMSVTTNPGNVFALGQAAGTVMINAGQQQSFTVTFLPPAAMSYQGILNITSNDPARPSVDYALDGGAMMMCTPAVPDPGEPTNDTCANAVARGTLNLDETTQSASWNESMLYPAMEEDWSRVQLVVAAGCTIVGYDLSATAALPAGEQAEVCIYVGDCASPDRMSCGSGTGRLFILTGGTQLCNQYNNDVPAYVRVRHTSGELSCTNYTLTFTGR